MPQADCSYHPIAHILLGIVEMFLGVFFFNLLLIKADKDIYEWKIISLYFKLVSDTPAMLGHWVRYFSFFLMLPKMFPKATIVFTISPQYYNYKKKMLESNCLQ